MEAIVIYHRNYKPEREEVIVGNTEEEIFAKYTDTNDMYKYCNGTYIRWKDNEWEKKYRDFLDSRKNNYFLARAVARGCLID